MKYSIFTLFIGTLFLQTSCSVDDQEIYQTFDNISAADGFYILNEGGFTHNNASLDFYNYETEQVSSSIFEEVNQTALGDVLQSAYFYDEDLFLVLNNSSKILRLDKDHKLIAEISGLASPRYMAFKANKAFVSDLYANKINLIDLDLNESIGSISCSGWTEELLIIDDYLIACLPDQSTIYLIDTDEGTIRDSLILNGRPSSIELDQEGKIWILGGSDYLGLAPASIHQISLSEEGLLIEDKSFNLGTDSGLFPSLCMNTERDSLFYAKGSSIYALPTSASTLASSPLFTIPSANIYGLDYHPIRKEILVADAVDYVQLGWVYRYGVDGQLIGQHSTGIIPNGFLFKP